MQHLRVAIDIIESARFPAMYADLLGFQRRIGSMFDILHRRPASWTRCWKDCNIWWIFLTDVVEGVDPGVMTAKAAAVDHQQTRVVAGESALTCGLVFR